MGKNFDNSNKFFIFVVDFHSYPPFFMCAPTLSEMAGFFYLFNSSWTIKKPRRRTGLGDMDYNTQE